MRLRSPTGQGKYVVNRVCEPYLLTVISLMKRKEVTWDDNTALFLIQSSSLFSLDTVIFPRTRVGLSKYFSIPRTHAGFNKYHLLVYAIYIIYILGFIKEKVCIVCTKAQARSMRLFFFCIAIDFCIYVAHRNCILLFYLLSFTC
jgi:hypothetical protein